MYPPLAELSLPPPIGSSLLVAYLGGLGLVELLLTVSVPAAAGGYGLVALAVCIALPHMTDQRSASLLPVLAAIPVVRLATVAAPTADFAPLARLGLLAVPTFVAVVAVAHSDTQDRHLLRPGPGGWAEQAALPLVGVPLGMLVYLLGPPTPQLRGQAPVIAVIALLVLAVIPDELLFRGLLVPAATDVAGAAGVPLAAAAYAATFVAYGSMTLLATAFVVGLVLSWFRQRTGSAVGVIGARIVVALLVYLVLPAVWA